MSDSGLSYDPNRLLRRGQWPLPPKSFHVAADQTAPAQTEEWFYYQRRPAWRAFLARATPHARALVPVSEAETRKAGLYSVLGIRADERAAEEMLNARGGRILPARPEPFTEQEAIALGIDPALRGQLHRELLAHHDELWGEGVSYDEHVFEAARGELYDLRRKAQARRRPPDPAIAADFYEAGQQGARRPEPTWPYGHLYVPIEQNARRLCALHGLHPEWAIEHRFTGRPPLGADEIVAHKRALARLLRVQPEQYTLKEIADVLSVSVATVKKYLASGKGSHSKLQCSYGSCLPPGIDRP